MRLTASTVRIGATPTQRSATGASMAVKQFGRVEVVGVRCALAHELVIDSCTRFEAVPSPAFARAPPSRAATTGRSLG